ncbi:MAG: hypothetical protein GF381_02085 [Candidatus Pacebacteria bacterium]|nr:hypothetical protein [Candidatus Paceibacterota bacterium]
MNHEYQPWLPLEPIFPAGRPSVWEEALVSCYHLESVRHNNQTFNALYRLSSKTRQHLKEMIELAINQQNLGELFSRLVSFHAKLRNIPALTYFPPDPRLNLVMQEFGAKPFPDRQSNKPSVATFATLIDQLAEKVVQHDGELSKRILSQIKQIKKLLCHFPRLNEIVILDQENPPYQQIVSATWNFVKEMAVLGYPFEVACKIYKAKQLKELKLIKSVV